MQAEIVSNEDRIIFRLSTRFQKENKRLVKP